MAELKKEAAPLLIPAALMAGGKALAWLGGGSKLMGLMNAGMYGPMLWDAAKWAKNKILPAVGRPGRYAANFPSPAPFQPGVLSSYGRYGGYGSVHSAELKERKLAFEAGIDRFCKEAGFDEEDRLAMYSLIKKATTSLNQTNIDTPKTQEMPHFLDLVGEEEPAKNFQEYTARALAKFNPNRALGYLSPMLGGVTSELFPGGNQLGADLSNRILTSIGGDPKDFDRARKRQFLQDVMADPKRFGAGRGMIEKIKSQEQEQNKQKIIENTLQPENLTRYLGHADNNLDRLGEIIRLNAPGAFATTEDAINAIRAKAPTWAQNNIPPPKPTPPAMGTGTPTDLSQPVINPVPPVERLPARAAPQPGPVMPPPTPAPPPPGNVPPAQPSPQNTANFVPEGMAARMAQMKYPGGQFFQSGKGWGMVPGEPMELPSPPPPPGGGGGGGGLMGMFRAFMGGEGGGGGGGAPGGGGMNLAQTTTVPEVTAPPAPKPSAPAAPKPAETSA